MFYSLIYTNQALNKDLVNEWMHLPAAVLMNSLEEPPLNLAVDLEEGKQGERKRIKATVKIQYWIICQKGQELLCPGIALPGALSLLSLFHSGRAKNTGDR